MFARPGESEKDSCAFQHISSDQLNNALGNDNKGEGRSQHVRSHSKGSGCDGSQGLEGKGKSKGTGKGKHKIKNDASPADQSEDNIDLKVLPVVVRRQWSKPRWCSDFLKGRHAKDACPFPHMSETIVAKIKDKDNAYKTTANAHQESRNRGKRGPDS